jgi:hypothetical protein
LLLLSVVGEAVVVESETVVVVDPVAVQTTPRAAVQVRLVKVLLEQVLVLGGLLLEVVAAAPQL